MKKVEYVNFRKQADPELIEKLNKVADIEHRPVHNLARLILITELDKRLTNRSGSPD